MGLRRPHAVVGQLEWYRHFAYLRLRTSEQKKDVDRLKRQASRRRCPAHGTQTVGMDTIAVSAASLVVTVGGAIHGALAGFCQVNQAVGGTVGGFGRAAGGVTNLLGVIGLAAGGVEALVGDAAGLGHVLAPGWRRT